MLVSYHVLVEHFSDCLCQGTENNVVSVLLPNYCIIVPKIVIDWVNESVSPLGVMFKTPSEASLTSKTTSVISVHHSKSPNDNINNIVNKMFIHFLERWDPFCLTWGLIARAHVTPRAYKIAHATARTSCHAGR